MSEATHVRAERLIAQDRVEGISSEHQDWLQQHLQECPRCAAISSVTSEALRSLRAVSIPVSRTLVSQTQFRVRLRAQQLQQQEPRWRMIWFASGVSWAFGAVTAPYLWHGLQWLGQRAGVPNFVWEMGFGLWWALPAIVAGTILLMEKARRNDESDWMAQQR